ncbi:MAG: hypothetical protein H6R33_930 [Actinobacteria bacterium]|jgi:hypothetical protein|nr:hypothetical protein [Actinomycetota bacterium]
MKVEKADLEAKLREIQGAVDETATAARGAVVVAVVVVVAIALFFLLGKRKGKKGSARVEVFRLG